METIQMQSAMAHQQHHHQLHQMPFRPTGPGPGPGPGLPSGGHSLDGQPRLLSSSPFPDFQLAELHQTLENLINIPNNSNQNGAGNPGQTYHLNGPSVSATGDMPFMSMEQSDLCRHPSQHLMNNNGNNNVGHNSNKRMSVDLGCSLSDYSESWSTNSPRSNASSEESLDNNPLQMKQMSTKGSTAAAQKLHSIYPTNNVKRQNVGRNGVSTGASASAAVAAAAATGGPHQLNNATSHPSSTGNVALMQQQQNAMLRHQLQQQSSVPPYHLPSGPPMLTPPMLPVHFMARPRMFDFTGLGGHRLQLHHHPNHIRNPMVGTPPLHQQPQQRMSASPMMMHPNQQQQLQQPNFCFPAGGPMGPPQPNTAAAASQQAEAAHQTEKRSRFMRTAQILEQSGLMDVTMKTAGLMRENALLQREIDLLAAETHGIERQFMAVRGGATGNNVSSIPQQAQQQQAQQQQAQQQQAQQQQAQQQQAQQQQAQQNIMYHQQQQQQLHPAFQQQQQDSARMQFFVQTQMNVQQQQQLIRGGAPMPPHLALEY
ncbi:hypothetical protein BV898_13809 [Hypsibius exemplaris]|uniref:Uncharacterized protein n=1 Tax=Hypsibius exemplaris TaxID=2072580 RepID=A0A1W0W9P5_HYPEX|nr:hypothetical protein BV898_13809 [Hypsibius exemplaris]